MNDMHNNYNGQHPVQPHHSAGFYGSAPDPSHINAGNYGMNMPVFPTPGVVAPIQMETPHLEDLQITSVSDLHMYGKGQVVRFPDFAEGQPFIARVRRPSMLVLAKQGKIPNALLSSANELFTNGGNGMDTDNPKMLSDIYDMCEVIAEAALMQPTYAEIKQAGVELSDNQLMALFSYTQNGIKALESFR